MGRLAEQSSRRALLRALRSTAPAAALLWGTACVAPAPLPAVLAAPPDDVVFVVPEGTAAAKMRGDPAFAWPSDITLVAGQRIVVRNEDQAMHYFFYLPIAPGQTVSKTFDQPGEYGYSSILSCSIGNVENLTVHVQPRSRSRS